MEKQDHKLILDLIMDSIVEIRKDLKEINYTLNRNTSSLEHHIKRTDLLQEDVTSLKEELEPIKTHTNYAVGSLKAVGIVALLAGLFQTFLSFLKR